MSISVIVSNSIDAERIYLLNLEDKPNAMNFKTDVNYRKETLVKLLHKINLYEDEVINALYADFRKSAFESVLSETAFVVSDLKHTIRHMRSWSKTRMVWPSILNFPTRDYIYREPYGKVLIIAPWNYPFQLAMCPLIAAIAAGNEVVLKPSEFTPNTTAIIRKIILETFTEDQVKLVEGDADAAQQLLDKRWDYIFFTGSVAVGKIVAKAAAENLTPVTLELGGKNPCIVDNTASLKLAARRIVWGKFLNAGQTCIAPDYILVQNKIKHQFVDCLKEAIVQAYGADPKLSPDLPRIISSKHWQRLNNLMEGHAIAFGGQADPDDLYISPTLIDEPSLHSALMQEEIFGPILPIVSYESNLEIETIIHSHEKPLSLYVFTTNKRFAEKMIERFSFGGGCINDTVIQFSNKRLPFGGVGHSGIGAYHGKMGFESFSHRKPIVRKANWFDLPIRYAPYNGKLTLLRKILKWL